jgi:hypothetical protein
MKTESGLDKEISIATRNMTEAVVSGKWFVLSEKKVLMPDGSWSCDIRERDLQNLCVEAVTEILAQAVQEALARQDKEYPRITDVAAYTNRIIKDTKLIERARWEEELVEKIDKIPTFYPTTGTVLTDSFKKKYLKKLIPIDDVLEILTNDIKEK